MSGECVGLCHDRIWRKLIVQSPNMTLTCKLLFCSKLSCSVDYAVEYCRCIGKYSNTGVKKVNVVDTNRGSFGVNKEGRWVFKSCEGHVWLVEKIPDPQENEIETAELGAISKANSFKEIPGDSLFPIYSRVQLGKRRMMKKRQAKVLILENPHLPTINQS